MHHVEAKYFDGQSSVAHKITLVFDERINELRFQFENGDSLVWRVDDLNFEQYGDCLEIRNKHFAGAFLQITNEPFSKQFFKAMKRANKVDVHHRILSIGFRKIVAIAVAMLALIVVSYIYLLPTIAERSAALLPETFDTALGNAAMRIHFNENRIDSVRTNLLEEFASQIDFKNTRELNFTVIESSRINAFALPNGQIVIYTGLLNRLRDANELAALLAHEAAHINYRHSIKMLSRNLAGYFLISLILSDVSGIMAVLADNAHQLHSLAYSRRFENEADAQGLAILMKNDIDPNGKVQLFDLIAQLERISIPEILSTHPLTEGRRENMERIIEKSSFEVLPQNRLDSLFVLMQR
jgi:predicted Zn-dependent protease